MAGRIGGLFEELKGRRAALITYATGFFPDRRGSAGAIRAMLSSGADAVEVGIPFSDPVMDGPVIQESSAAALRAGATTAGVLELVSEIRAHTDRPILLMTYYNPVFRYGLDRFASDAASAGADCAVVPDLPVEEMGPFSDACVGAGLDTVAFCAVNTSDARIKAAASTATGFLYCVPVLGTTGARNSLAKGLPGFLQRVRRNSELPLAVGVGVSTPEQCCGVGELADGVIVGSALVERLSQENGGTGSLSAMVAAMAVAISNGTDTTGGPMPHPRV